LKNKKTPGLDKILNEMIKYSQSELIQTYTKLFNDILRTGFYPKIWKEGYILPIYKNGDVSDPSNYRGITISSNIAKLFNAVIQSRLETFFEKHNLIDEKQIGFKKNSRTSDHIFILKCLTEKYMKNGNKLYTCFVDFKKAYDSVNHLKLLYKLRQTNIGTFLYNTIKDMYLSQNNNLQVKVANKLSEKFSSNKGVKQGDVLSPILFNFFINEINKYLISDEDTPILGNKQINSLLYADDLVLISRSPAGLQKQLNQLRQFCLEWDMDINTNKTKTMIFNNGGRVGQDKFRYGNTNVEQCKNYKYLGLMLQSNGKFTECYRNLYHRGLKAMFKLTKSFENLSPSYDTCIHLFDHLVKPILTYGSDVWGSFLMKGKSLDFSKLLDIEMEKCHKKFLRFAVGVNKRAPLTGLYGETGRYPIAIEMICNALKYVQRLQSMPENSLLYQGYVESELVTNKNAWLKNINRIKADININSADYSILEINKVFQDQYKNYWTANLFNDSNTTNGNKLRDYRKYKHHFRKEEYLSTLNSRKLRSSFAKLRLGAHKLHIETGRYSKEKLIPSERICKMCELNVCEDEFHFVMSCELYKDERANFLHEISKLFPFTQNFNNTTMFGWIMANLDENVLLKTGKYIHQIFEKRSANVSSS
jgi:hypothetical protein